MLLKNKKNKNKNKKDELEQEQWFALIFYSLIKINTPGQATLNINCMKK